MNSQEAKNIMLIVLSGIFYYLLSFLGHKIAFINTAIFLIICAAVLFLSIKRFEIAVGIAFLELILSSFGRMFFLDIYGPQITLRAALFAIIIGTWSIKQLSAFSFYPSVKRSWYYLPLFIVVILGIARGFINNNSFNNVFADANAFLFFGYLGPSMEAFKKAGWEKVRQVLTGGIIVLWLATIFSAIGFSHGLFEVGDGFYKWIRDSRLGEVTFVNDQFSRVFFQAHIYALISIFLFSSRQYLMLGVLAASIIWVDLSRSFWVGGAIGIFTLTCLKLFSNSRELENRKSVLIPILIVIAGFVLSTILLPSLPQIAFGRGAKTSDPASSSRKAMLAPLAKEILKNPIFGSGFGTLVTYRTQDPRALAKNPSGEITTFTFEWGWLDLWLKMGLLGVSAYLWLIFCVLKRLYKASEENKPLAYGLFAVIVALAVTHVFSPYLNHPLGIGILLFADAFAESS